MTAQKLNSIATLTMMTALAVTVFSTNAAAQKKMSLADIAALEWKLEQATKTLQTDVAITARTNALKELATLDDPRTIPLLALSLKEDPATEIRAAALKRLVHWKTPEVKGALTLASLSDPAASIRTAAKQELAKLSRMTVAAIDYPKSAFVAPKALPMEKELSAWVAHPSSKARAWLIESLDRANHAQRVTLGKRLFQDPASEVRIRAARVVSQAAKAESLTILTERLGDGDPAVRFEIARLISTYDSPAALAVLQTAIQQEQDKQVKAEIKELLEPSTAVGKRLLQKRIEELRSSNVSTRLTALDALSSFSEWQAMLPMACTLLEDESVSVRAKTAEVLSSMHDTSVLTALRIAAVSEPDAKLREKIRNLVQGLKSNVDTLLKTLEQGSPIDRAQAARALGQAAYPNALEKLIQASRDKEVKVRRSVARALGNFEDPKAFEALSQLLADSQKEVNEIASAHLQQQKRLEGWRNFYNNPNKLVAKTSDSDAVWRADAIVALGISGAERSANVIMRLLEHDSDERVRLAAAWALVLMASDHAEAALRKAAEKDSSDAVRLAAQRFLVIGKVSLDDLVNQLRDKEASVRAQAAEALALRATQTIQPALVRAVMCDSSASVRAAALRGLARLANPLSRTVLKVAAARDLDATVRKLALMMYILAGGK